MDTESNVSVCFVEDNNEVRANLKLALEQFPGYRCVSDYSSAEEALAGMENLQPDIVFMDINLPGMSGVECTRILSERFPSIDVIILTMFSEGELLFGALSAGACGYLLKRCTPLELKEAMDLARAGGAPMSPSIARQVVRSFKQQSLQTVEKKSGMIMQALSPREADVLRLLSEGLPYKGIAEECSVTINTIRVYIRSLYKKLQINSRQQAVNLYFGHGR